MVTEKICISITVLFLLLISCRYDFPVQQHQGISGNTAVDSLDVWLQEGKDITLDEAERRKNLNKALQAAEAISSDSLKIKYFSQLSLGYLRLNDSLAFRRANKEALELAALSRDSVVLAEANWDLAEFFNAKNVADSAYYHFGKAKEIYSAQGKNFFAARMLYNMAVVQNDIKDYTGAEITAIMAIELLKPLGEYKYLYNCYSILGVVAKNLKEYDRAIEYHKKALTYLDESADKNRFVPSTLNNLGMVFLEKQEYGQAQSYFQRVLEIDSLNAFNTSLYAKALNNLGLSRLGRHEAGNTLELFRKAIRIQDSIQDLSELSRSLHSLAEFYVEQKDTATALIYANRAKLYAQQSSNNNRLLETLHLLAMLDPIKAPAYIQEYITLNDSLQNEERQIRNKFARIRFETDEFIAQNELLAKQRQMWIGIAAGLLLLAVAMFVIINQRVQNQKLRFRQQQQEANQEIFNLMLAQKQKVEEGKQSVQKRISEELHDGVLGEMNGIRMVLLGLNQKSEDDAVEMRSKAIEKLQTVQEEIRTISHQLSDAAYQKFHNFIHSIQDLIKSVDVTTEAEITFHYEEHIDWDQLSADIQINVYRIVQECLTNCVKHAQARNISLVLDSSGGDLLVSLTDDGKGFDTNKGKKGIGHKNIRSRLMKVNGTWEIKSKIGKGTKIFVRIPYHTEAEDKRMEQEINGILNKV